MTTSPRKRLTARLRCIIAAQEWDGPIEVDDAEQIAADLIESAGLAELLDDDPRHVIEFRDDGWTIQHPLACRPNLFECAVNRAAEPDLGALDGPPAPPGRYECSVNDLGDRLLIGDRIESEVGDA